MILPSHSRLPVHVKAAAESPGRRSPISPVPSCGADPPKWGTLSLIESRKQARTVCLRKNDAVTRLLLVRHAEALKSGDTPGAEWPLTEKGRKDASLLGANLAGRPSGTIVLTSPERRARETADLAFPLVVANGRDQLSEVVKPWYASADEATNATTKYLQGEVVEGWERREDVIRRIAQLKSDFGAWESLVLVTHGVFLTTWLDQEIGLEEPFSFWSDLRMPDAWELDFDEKSLKRL
jgi:broad specificity phosphatase PhoE